MNFELNKIYHGFLLLKKEEIKEIQSRALVFTHEKSGARLIKLENDDENKVFSITFRTPPADNTGIPHILEHSVLCGSRKFNVKEPFVELKKGSLNTFLNAITFSDKTMYPIASKNHKDFFNLMDVYLDAVFYPNIYKNPMILMQEGWHYELKNKKDALTYKGVVYNEMKGSFSSPSYFLYSEIQNSLFLKNCYSFESGGNPDFIPDLTYDNFLNFHKKYYHPANSYIYLYGNGPTIDELEFINKNYLESFKKIDVDSKIYEEPVFKEIKEITIEYPVLKNESTKNKTYFTMNYVTGKSILPEIYTGFDILEYMLLETPASPLKKILIDNKIGKDAYGMLDNDILQPIFSIIVKDSDINKKHDFINLVNTTLTDLSKNGIDKNLIEAGINSHEFFLRESETDYPKGLYYNMTILTSWLYDEDPLLNLEFEPILDKIKKEAKHGFFESMIQEYLLDNNHKSILVMKPNPGLNKKNEIELSNKLKKIKNNMDDKKIEQLINSTFQLEKNQSEPDPAENLKSIPMLTLQDLDKQAEKLIYEEKKIDTIKLLHHPIFTGNIVYLNLYFNTKSIDVSQLQYINLLVYILGRISTRKYKYSELSNLIDIYTGGISFYHEVFSSVTQDNTYLPFINIKAKALTSKIQNLINIVTEIITNTIFDDKKRLFEIIQELKSIFEKKIKQKGHIFAQKRLASYFSQSGMYKEITGGILFFEFIKEIEQKFNSNPDSVIEPLNNLLKNVFNKNNLLISITGDDEDYKNFCDTSKLLINNLPDNYYENLNYNFELKKLNEALLAPSQVQYVTKGYNYKKLGYDFSGKMNVLKTILSYDYLWNNIRVKGGAYGAFISIERSGNLSLMSYRDPNLIETLKCFDDIPQYLKNFNVSNRELTKYIIGSISRLDSYLSPSQKGEKAAISYIIGLTQENLQKERDDIINININEIKLMAEMFEQILKENYICVFGNENKLNKHKNIFTTIKKIFD